MHRSRLARLLGAALLAMSWCCPRLASPAPRPRRGHRCPTIRLGCALVIPDPRAHAPGPIVLPLGGARRASTSGPIACGGRVDGGPAAAARHVAVRRARSATPTAHPGGHAYTTAWSDSGTDGSRVARSARRSRSASGGRAETLRFNCALVIDGAHRGVAVPLVRGHPARRGALRPVGAPSTAAAREAIYRIGEDGRRSFLDTDVKPGQASATRSSPSPRTAGSWASAGPTGS